MNAASIAPLEETRASARARRHERMNRGEEGAHRLIEHPDRPPLAFIIDAHEPLSL